MERPELMAARPPALPADLALADGYTVDAGDRLDLPDTPLAAMSPISAGSSLGCHAPTNDFATAIFLEDIFISSAPAPGLSPRRLSRTCAEHSVGMHAERRRGRAYGRVPAWIFGAGLSSGEIHVWTARLFDDDRATAGLLPILDQEERARAAQFSFERDRTRFIQTHGIVRRIGGRATGTSTQRY